MIKQHVVNVSLEAEAGVRQNSSYVMAMDTCCCSFIDMDDMLNEPHDITTRPDKKRKKKKHISRHSN